MWSKLFSELVRNSCSLSSSEIAIQPVAKPRPTDIHQFEMNTGLILPRGYKEYVLAFGPGLLARYFFIAAPGYQELGSPIDLLSLNQTSPSHQPADFLEEVHGGNIDQIRRLFFFCETEGAESIGWDPSDCRDVEDPEYGIYLLPRSGKLINIASTYSAFVSDICLGNKLPTILDIDPSEWGGVDRRDFVPVSQPPSSEKKR
jgi:hypothetical protein